MRWKAYGRVGFAATIFVLLLGGAGAVVKQITPIAGDVDFSGFIDAVDVQLVINAALGINIDADNDGLPDITELRLGSNPNSADSDGDGVLDFIEFVEGTLQAPPIAVSGISPPANETCVPVSTTILLEFSTGADFQDIGVTIQPAANYSETWSPGNTAVTLTPTSALAADTVYTITVDAVGGVALAQPFAASFTTEPMNGCGGQSENVFYVSPAGNDANPGTMAEPWKTITKAASTLTAGQTVMVGAGTYNEQVLPQNSGTEGNYITYMAAPGENVVIDGTGLTLSNPQDLGGLFAINTKSYIRVSGFTVANAGNDPDNHYLDAGIIAFQCNAIIIDNNITQNTVSSGIAAWNCTNITVDNNEVIGAVSGGLQECITMSNVNTFDVMNNKVHDDGASVRQRGGEGIDAKDGCTNGRIFNNEVYNLSFSLGIYIESAEAQQSGIHVFGNWVHDITQSNGIVVAAEQGNLNENITVENNIVENCACAGINVLDNDMDPNNPAPSHPVENVTIRNNTVFNNGQSCEDSDGGGGIQIRNTDARNITIFNNIVSGNRDYQIATNVSEHVTADSNLIFETRNHAFEILGTNAVQADPLFVNAAANNFALQASSPAVDAGSAANAPAVDFFGTSRPIGEGIDIGAVESH
jgi:hypothetical protein